MLFRPQTNSSSFVISGNSVQHIDKMLRFIAANFTHRLTVQDVAREAGVSPNYAITLFKKMLGRTVKEHITDMRIVHAKMLLVETDRKILSVAMDCGFPSLSSFYEAFSCHTGTSPAAFRKDAGVLSVRENRLGFGKDTSSR